MLTNTLNLPQPFADAATSDHEYTPGRYSVTDVLGGTCEAILKRRHHGESDEDVADRVWAIFGTAVHKVLQEAKAADTQTQEEWMAVPVPGTDYHLSGIFDLYDEATETVTDWKTCSVWKLQVGDFNDWRSQTLMYCWMLRQQGKPASHGEIVAIMRDHNKRKAETDKDYPPHPVMRLHWDFDETDFAVVEDAIVSWFARVINQEKMPDEKLLPCNGYERWHKDDTWAVVKNGNKRATRVLKDVDEAHDLCDKLNESVGKPHHVEFRPGEDTKCQGYCSVAQFCPYGRKFFEIPGPSE